MIAYRVGRRVGRGGHAAWGTWIVRIAGLLAFAVAGTAFAQASPNSIEQVSVIRGTSGNTVVRFTLKAPPANPPAGFTIVSPPRIALDFMDTTNGLASNQRAVDDPALRSLQFVEAGGRTRVVFNLNKPQIFDTRVEGNAVLVTLADSGSAAAQAAPARAQSFAVATSTTQQHALRDVDFRRGRNGEGRIIVDLSDTGTGIDIRQQGRQLIVDFQKTTVPANLERRMDVGDFNTPVVTVDTFPKDGNARMVIEPKG
ncbi:MAG TPA: AMIN domain-containing protein, partial [Casimicrobiaceae bacterium]